MVRNSLLATCLIVLSSAALAACGSSSSGGGSGGSSGSGGAGGSAGGGGSAGAAAVAQVVDCATVTPAKTVNITGAGPFTFDPADVTVSVGDAIEWDNTTIAPHTSTSGQAGTPPTSDGKWDTGQIDPSTGKACVKFLAAGTYPYHCSFHTTMSGTVTVQ